MHWTTLFTIFAVLASSVQAFVGFNNPLKDPNGSDPFMVYDSGYYYLTTTTWNDVQITRSKTIAGLKTATPKVVYTSTASDRCCKLWAPELHKVDGIWYIYFSAGINADYNGQRPNVLQGVATDPYGPYTWKSKLLATNSPDVWSIDGTVLTVSGKNYFVYSAFSPNNLQSLYIAPMTNAYTLGARTLLSEPTASWEVIGQPVNEGPQPLYNGTRTWLAYSASYCGTSGYSIGLLEFKGGDPTKASSWTKSGPVFTSANGNYGPAHNGFFKSPDGKETWLVYHASKSDPAHCDGSRVTMAQKLNWHTDGSPLFGSPRSRSDLVPVPSGDGM